jgi:hypothetical protein
MPDDDGKTRLRCPHCDALCAFDGTPEAGMVAFCGKCHGVITREVKRAFFKGVSAEISARQVGRDNRDFLVYLDSGWRRTGEEE